MLKSLSALPFLLLAVASCGDDNNPNRPDARPIIDADDFDAEPIDAEPAVTTHSATISVLDVRVRTTTGAVDAVLGSGGQVVASMMPVAGDVPGVVDAPGQIYDDRSPTTGAGCSAFVWDLSVPQIPPSGEGHGALTITGGTATIPTCNFVGDEYLCLGAGGALANTDDLNFNAGTVAMTVAGAAFTAADVGRYVKISGATNFRNNGTFPIVMAPSGTTLVYANQQGSDQAAGTGVTYQIVAGVGPVPGAPSPEFLADADSVTVALDAPAGDEFEDYTSTATSAGDNFSLTPTSNTTIVNIPADGSSFTIGCDPAVVAHAAGVGPSLAFDDASDTVTLTDVTVNFNTLGVRNGAEVIISGATTAGNNSPAVGFTITAHTATTLTFANATGFSELFATTTAYTVNDCGISSLSALNIDFSDATLTSFISGASGTGPNIVNLGGNPCQIMSTGAFSVGLAGAMVTISGADDAGNNGTFTITTSDADMIQFDNAGCVTDGFSTGTAYEVFDNIAGAATEMLMPDPLTSHATKIGHIQCAALASQSVTVPAGASEALMMVNPPRTRTVYVRAGLAQVANADMTNPSNVLVGHAVVGFSTP